MNNIEYKGVWWLPGNSKNYIIGILSFNSDEGVYLELIGQLDSYDKYNIILGRTSDGRKITLYKCFEVNKTHNSNGFVTTRVFANIIFEGVHFNSDDDIKFSEISCHYSNLDEWAWMQGPSINVEKNKINITHEVPIKKSVQVNEKYDVEIYPDTEISPRCIVQKEASIIQKIYLKVVNKELDSFEEHISQLRHLQNFISLGVGKPIIPIDIIGKTEINKEKFGERYFYPSVKIYFSIRKGIESDRVVLPPHMLFNLPKIGDDINIFLINWFERREILEPIINLYFGIIYNNHMYLEQKFSNLIQAIESYHRRTKLNAELDQSEHEERINSILDSVDIKYSDWLRGRLSYSNEPTLRKRLNDMMSECNDILNLSSRERKSFITKVCNTRNYLTHYDISLADKAAKNMELLEICNKLKVIIEFYLLLEIGFNNEMAKNILNNKIR
ncbi:hypothetical protein GNF85_06905 [Clostridium perfringens]